MAEVFRATQPGFGGFEKTVAIKRMFSQYAHDEKFVEMLTDEAKIVSQLAHPNIVQILDIGRVHEDYYIAFEFVDGVDVFRLLQRHYELKRDIPIALVLHIVSELCAALDHAHARHTADDRPMHIIHRDVSPQNVLLSYQGEVKLTDFGIAKAAYRFTHTQAGVVKGKLYYMSPEQARGRDLDHRSDLFSVGILLWELLCTRPLYDEEDQGRLMSVVGAAEYKWPPEKKQRVQPALVAAVERALSPDPEQRFQTGREFRETLMQIAAEAGLHSDRETLGGYLRTIYDVADNRPPTSRPAPQRKAKATEGASAHWVSTVAPMPTEGWQGERGSAPAVTMIKAPKPATTAQRQVAEVPAPPPAADDDLPPPLDALLMQTTKPLSQHRRELAASQQEAPPLVVASAARPAPAAPLPAVDSDESTAMLDMAEMQKRLAGMDAPTAEPDAVPTMGLDVVRLAPAAPPPAVEVPAKAVEAEAATRFVQAMQPEVSAFRADGTTERPAPPGGPGRALLTRTATPPPEIPSAPAPDEEPATWALLGVTAAVWAGVLVLGVYATLLVVSK